MKFGIISRDEIELVSHGLFQNFSLLFLGS